MMYVRCVHTAHKTYSFICELTFRLFVNNIIYKLKQQQEKNLYGADLLTPTNVCFFVYS